jgi:DNA-binding beta-propeller fold protein YncE
VVQSLVTITAALSRTSLFVFVMGQPVGCRQCGAAFLMTAVSNPPPRCPQCGGQLALLPQQPQGYAPPGMPFGAPGGGGYGQPAYGKPGGGVDNRRVVLVAAIGGGALLLFLMMAGAAYMLWPRSKPPVANIPGMQPVQPAPSPFSPPTQPTISPPTWTPPSSIPPRSSPTPSLSPGSTLPSTIDEPSDDPSDDDASTSTSRPAAGRINTTPSNLGRFGGSSEEQFKPRVAWKVQPDPLSEPLEFTVPMKPMTVATETSRHSTHVVFPRRPSYFVALGLDDYKNKQVRVLDLRTGKAVAKFPGDLDREVWHSALSADGRYVATIIDRPQKILVAESKTGKVVRGIDLEDRSRLLDMAFAGDGQLVTIVQEDYSKARSEIWNVVEGQPIADFPLELKTEKERYSSKRYIEHSLAISPGGRYFAAMISNVVCVYEVDSGKLAGETQLPSEGYSSQGGLAFSPDGNELAAFTESGGKVIHTIDVKSGDIASSTSVATGEFDGLLSHGRDGPPIQYLPELGAYLINGTLVVEATTGEAVYGIKAFGGGATRVLPGNRLVGMYATDGGKGGAFGEFRLPSAEIAKLTDALKGGGTLFDGLLGPAKDGDVSAADHVRLPLNEVAWSMEPFSTDEVRAPRKPINLPTPSDSWNRSGKPVLNYTGTKFAWLPERRDAHSRLYGADASTGKVEGDIDVLPNSRALDISPDGSLVLVAVTKSWGSQLNARRLEVYSLEKKKHVFAWRLEPEVPTEGQRNTTNTQFAGAHFIEKNLVLTETETGRLMLWTLPEAKATWVFDGKLKIAGFSPGRRYVLLHDREHQKLRWMEVRTGKWCGDWKYDGYQEPALAFSPNGDKIAHATTLNGYTALRIYKVSDGSPVKEYVVPPLWASEERISWNAERYLLVDRVLFDLENGAPAWQIHVSGQPLIGPDGKYWFIETARGGTSLSPSEVPSDDMLRSLAKLKPKPVAPIIGPGTRMSVQVGSLAGGLNPSEAQKVLEQQVESRGWVVDPAAPFKLFASSSEGSESVTYADMMGKGKETVSIRKVTTTYRITDAAGKEVWKTEFTSSQHAPFIVHVQQGQSVQSKIDQDGFNQSLKHSVSGSGIPLLIFPADAYSKLQTTFLNGREK